MAETKEEKEPKKPKAVKLKVFDAIPEDAYKGIVRIDPEVMRDLDLKKGDMILIKGNRGAATIAMADKAHPTDVGEGVIRIDGIIRRNAKTGIGDIITVSKAEVKEAKKISPEPLQENVVEELKQKDEIIIEQKKLTKTATKIARQAALNLGNETRKHTVTAIVAAFGFLIALVWRDTIQGLVSHLISELSFQGPPLLLTFYATLITTIIAVIGIILVTKWGAKKEDGLENLKIQH